MRRNAGRIANLTFQGVQLGSTWNHHGTGLQSSQSSSDLAHTQVTLWNHDTNGSQLTLAQLQVADGVETSDPGRLYGVVQLCCPTAP